jgi:hypothetical protein
MLWKVRSTGDERNECGLRPTTLEEQNVILSSSCQDEVQGGEKRTYVCPSLASRPALRYVQYMHVLYTTTVCYWYELSRRPTV